MVASDIFVVSLGGDGGGPHLLGNAAPQSWPDLARTRLRTKMAQLLEALTGQFSDHHAFLLAQMLSHVHDLDRRIAVIEGHLDDRLAPFQRRADTSRRNPWHRRAVAAQILAEIGTHLRSGAHS